MSFDDDEEGWEDMPVVRSDTFLSGMDEEDQKRYHYIPKTQSTSAANATGNLIDVDEMGNEWRAKLDQNESEYTRLRGIEEDETDEVHLRTKYLFDEDKAMTPLSQMQATKNLLTEAQRIAYVGLCALTSEEMWDKVKKEQRKELKNAVASMQLWKLKIMGRLYYHMELETAEQKMIESLSVHGVQPSDLVPALMTTRTVANPEYDPEEARRLTDTKPLPSPLPPSPPPVNAPPAPAPKPFQTTTKVLEETAMSSIPGVSTSLSTTDESVTLDIRWTILCDLFLLLIADSVYDARSRVLLESVALHLGLGWLDVVKFESRITEALEIQEDVEKTENADVIDGVRKANRKKRYMMLGLATIGGGLVIGLSAGLLAPVIGVGLGAALGTIGISGTTGFLAGAGGAAVITTGGVLTGSSIAMRGMLKRTKQVSTFDLLPLHNNKRVNCIITVPGFLNGKFDDPRLPFSVLDPVVGDVFSILWEPEMIRETGSALKILTGEVLSQIGQTVLQATVMTALMSALQWPIILTKLGYLIDNPWNNALDRARAAGAVLGDVLIKRHLGVRPITLIGFSLGARVIFYALLHLAKEKAFGIVQDVFLLGTTLSVSQSTWLTARSAVSGRFVNAFARNDWVLNYLFRATSGGVGTVAGLRPIEGVRGLENVDVTDKIAGHMSYRSFMPLILDQLGFKVFADWFDDVGEGPDGEGEWEYQEEEKKGWFGGKTGKNGEKVQRPPGPANWTGKGSSAAVDEEEEDLPPRTETPPVPSTAGFDLSAIKEMVDKEKDPTGTDTTETKVGNGDIVETKAGNGGIVIPPPTMRSESVPPPSADEDEPTTPKVIARSVSLGDTRAKLAAAAAAVHIASLDLASTSSSSSPTEETPTWPPTSTFSSSGVRTPFTSLPSNSLGYNPFASPPSSSSLAASSTRGFGSGTELSFGTADGSFVPSFSSLGTGPEMTGLSFGNLDGSIATSSLGRTQGDDEEEDDPWGIPKLSLGGGGGGGGGSAVIGRGGGVKRQNSAGFGGNPWS